MSPYLSKANSLDLYPPQYARLDQWLFFGWKFITWWPNRKCSKRPKETFGEKIHQIRLIWMPLKFPSKSISSSCAQYVTLRKYFSHPSLVAYSFATPPIKLKLGQQIGGGLLIANHLDESLRFANQKHWAAIKSYLWHSFLQVQRRLYSCTRCRAFYQPHQRVHFCRAKTIFLSQTVKCWIFFI